MQNARKALALILILLVSGKKDGSRPSCSVVLPAQLDRVAYCPDNPAVLQCFPQSYRKARRGRGFTGRWEVIKVKQFIYSLD